MAVDMDLFLSLMMGIQDTYPYLLSFKYLKADSPFMPPGKKINKYTNLNLIRIDDIIPRARTG